MMKKGFILILAMGTTIIFVLPVKADFIQQDAHHDFDIDPEASSFGPQYMGGLFTQFDDQDGTRILERVTLTYGITASAHVTVENDTEYFMDTVTVTSSVHLGVSPWPSPVDMYEEYMTDLQPSDGVSGSGPDFYDFGIISLDGGGGYWETTSDLDWFSSGDPADEFVFDGSAEFALGGGWSPTLTVSDFTSSMNATLTYEYSVVPEPATVLLFGLGGLVLRKGKKN